MISVLALALLFCATTTGAAGIVLMKKGMFEFSFSRILKNKVLLLGMFLFGVSTIFFISSLQFGELHLLYSLTAMTYVWLLFLSKKYLGEHITRQKVIGVCLILCGIVLMSFS